MSERTRAAVYQRVLGHGSTRRSQATQRGQNWRTQAVGNALARTEACALGSRSALLPGITRSISTQMTHPQQQQPSGAFGSFDGGGAGDEGRLHRFRCRPRAAKGERVTTSMGHKPIGVDGETALDVLPQPTTETPLEEAA